MIPQGQMLFLVLVAATCCLVDGSNIASTRGRKALSLFNVVQFSNGPCPGTGNRNGTCYTETECTQKNGVAAGTCASGYGICCTFSATCGQTSSENCTYFESSTVPIGACRLKICKCNDNICQLRLDFNSFVISGPVTLSSSTGKAINGIVTATGTKDVNLATQCLTDRFSVTNPGSSSPPTICGTNTGTHMYVDANENCNELAFQLGSSSSVNRQWSIKITQYACDFDNLAPEGCTQYHFGSNSGTVKNYNYDGGAHLANQEQKICVRQESGNCETCYFQIEKTDFRVSGKTSKATGYTAKTQCCGYGSKGDDVNGYDCVVIPGALKQTDKQDPALGSQFCGGILTTIDAGTDGKTVCTKQRPFHITFRSDHFEHPDESKKMITEGFRLAYTQKSC